MNIKNSAHSGKDPNNIKNNDQLAATDRGNARLVTSGRWAKFGLFLIGFSTFLWLLLIVVPFLPGSAAQRGWIAGALLVLAEIAGWWGVILAGPEAAKWLWHRIKAFFNRSKSGEEEVP